MNTPINTPFNDAFAEARPVFGDRSILRTTLRGATVEAGQPAIHEETNSGTIWFTFTASANGAASVRSLQGESFLNPTNGQTEILPFDNFPVAVAVFTGDTLETLEAVDSGVDEVSFVATAGETYRIAVAAIDDQQGLLVLEITGAPRNSTLANATPLRFGNSATGTNHNALSEPGEPAHAGQPATASVWYSWTSNLTGKIVFTTRGSSFNTVAAVYAGPDAAEDFADLVPLASNDDEVGRTTSRIEFVVEAGVTYYFAVDGKNGATGQISALLAIPPQNDHFASPTILSGTDVTRNISTNLASREAGEPVPFPGRGRGESIWFAWTAPEAGRTTIDLSASFFPGMIAVYTGTTLENLQLVTRDGAGNRFAQVTFDAEQGVTYRIMVDAWDFSLLNVPLRLRVLPVPPNDTFANAIALQGLRDTAVGSNVGSSREPGEPENHSNGGNSVWYTWTAPSSGWFAIYGERLNRPDLWSIVLNVFTGPAVNQLTHVKLDIGNGIGRDAFVFWQAQAGTTYHIQVTGLTRSGIIGGIGPFSLDLRPLDEHTAPNWRFANAMELDPSRPVYNLRTHSYGARSEPGEPAHSGYSADETLWWRFTALESARHVFSTALSEGSRGLTVYRTTQPGNPTFASLVPVANNVATATQLFNEVAWSAIAGETYFIVSERMQGGRGRHIVHFQRVPDNITFAGRAAIVGESARIEIQNHGAIREPGEPTFGVPSGSLGHRSLWWEWTAPASGRYQLDTIGSETPTSEDGIAYPDRTILGFDTRLGVFVGTSAGNLTQIAVNDSRTKESFGNSWIDFQRNSRLEFSATAGTTYVFLVNGENLDTMSQPNQTNTGLIKLNLQRLREPANTRFANATVIEGTHYHEITTNFGAVKESGEHNHAGLSGGRSLWWRWTAPESGRFVASTAGLLYDDYHSRQTAIAVYTGTALGALTQITANQNGAGINTGQDTWSLAEFDAVAGQTYHSRWMPRSQATFPLF
ncbi:MAG: hypothetical protein LR015_08430 [Verrucomicrobia bacterium]|nr:hypothetical protein [Verrucomicrobiota bacterium]